MRYFILIFILFLNGIAGATEEEKIPNVYAVYQQQGPVCPYIPFVNLKLIRQNREANHGVINLETMDYHSKLSSYMQFLPRIVSLDRIYDNLRSNSGPYKLYEDDIRKNGIQKGMIFDQNGKTLDEIDWNPIKKSRRETYTPYNFEYLEDVFEGEHLLPIFSNKNDSLFFYNIQTKEFSVIDYQEAFEPNVFKISRGNDNYLTCRIDDAHLNLMNLSINEFLNKFTYISEPSKKLELYVKKFKEDQYNRHQTYHMGTFEHLLFAMGVNRQNKPLNESDRGYDAHLELKQALDSDPQNPWYMLNKEDLFEYHLANVFIQNPDLKAKAKLSLNFYNDVWKLYEESLDFYDAPQPPRKSMREKSMYLPGEEQILAFFFSNQLRFVWSASISNDAIFDLADFEDITGPKVTSFIKSLSFIPVIPSHRKVINAALSKKYTYNGVSYSFMDTWLEVKNNLSDKLDETKDFVTFYTHGCVISFDSDLVAKQYHEDRSTAELLGITYWDSLADKSHNPFYRKKGTPEDIIRVPD